MSKKTTITHSICLQHFRMEFFLPKRVRPIVWLDHICVCTTYVYTKYGTLEYQITHQIEYRKSDIYRTLEYSQKGHGCIASWAHEFVCDRMEQRENLYIDRILHWWPLFRAQLRRLYSFQRVAHSVYGKFDGHSHLSISVFVSTLRVYFNVRQTDQ